MVRTEEQNARLRDATREAIETAAVTVFARRGFAAASVQQIADAAGVSAGSIYRHYESKEALFDALLTQAASGLDATATLFDAEGDPLVIVRDFTTRFLDDLESGDGAAEFYRVMDQAAITDSPAGAASRLAAGDDALWAAFAQLVRRGQEAQVFLPGDAEQLTATFFATLSGLAALVVARRSGVGGAGPDVVLRLLVGGVTS